MKNALIAGILIGSMLLPAACAAQVTKEPPPGVRANEEMAMAVAQALVNRDFDAARSNFDTTMLASLSKEKLEDAWDQYGGNKGAFKGFGQTYIEYARTSPLVFIPCIFENAEIVLQVTQDAEGILVTGLFLRPPGFSFL
jgi:hypothetical protein